MNISGGFRRDLLPAPLEYYRAHGVKLLGRGEWRSALCPFHDDTEPSLRVIGAIKALYRDYCEQYGVELALSQGEFRAAMKAMGLAVGSEYATGLALTADFIPRMTEKWA